MLRNCPVVLERIQEGTLFTVRAAQKAETDRNQLSMHRGEKSERNMVAEVMRCLTGAALMRYLIACLIVALVVPTGACADDASVGVSLAPLFGTHEETGLKESVPPIPVPILQARGRLSNVELFVESFPFSPQIVEGGGGSEQLSTNLAFFDAVIRGYALHDRVSAGLGELIYNQSTTYTPPGTVDASRVVGGRYELGVGLLRDARKLRLFVDLMPSLTGAIHATFPNGFRPPDQPEVGSQVEVQLRPDHVHGAFEFDYGARYVNYTAKFVHGGSLADRNTGILPFATFAYRI